MNNPLGIPDHLKVLIDAGLDAEQSAELRDWVAGNAERRRLLERVLEVNRLFDDQVRDAMARVSVPQGSSQRVVDLIEQAEDTAARNDIELNLASVEDSGRERTDRRTHSDFQSGWEPGSMASSSRIADGDPSSSGATGSPSRNHRSDRSQLDSRQLNRRHAIKRWAVRISSLAMLVVILLGAYAVFSWNQRPLVDSDHFAMQSREWTTTLEQQELTEEIPISVSGYPMCRDVRDEWLPDPRYGALNTEFGLTRAMVWNVPRGFRTQIGFGKAYLLTVPYNLIQRWNFQFDLDSKMPKSARVCSRSPHQVAASVDPRGFVHILYVEESLVYQKILRPEVDVTMLPAAPSNRFVRFNKCEWDRVLGLLQQSTAEAN